MPAVGNQWIPREREDLGLNTGLFYTNIREKEMGLWDMLGPFETDG